MEQLLRHHAEWAIEQDRECVAVEVDTQRLSAWTNGSLKGMLVGSTSEGWWPAMPSRRTFSTAEAAKLLGVSTTTVHNWLKSRRLTGPPHEPGKRVRVFANRVEHLRQQQLVEQGDQPVASQLTEPAVEQPVQQPDQQSAGSLLDLVTALESRIDDLELRLGEAIGHHDDLSSSNLAILAANTALQEAFDRRGEAMERDAEARSAERQAGTKANEAATLYAAALTNFNLPSVVPRGASTTEH